MRALGSLFCFLGRSVKRHVGRSQTKKLVGVCLDVDLAQTLRAKAARQERTSSALIRKLLHEELEDGARRGCMT